MCVLIACIYVLPRQLCVHFCYKKFCKHRTKRCKLCANVKWQYISVLVCGLCFVEQCVSLHEVVSGLVRICLLKQIGTAKACFCSLQKAQHKTSIQTKACFFTTLNLNGTLWLWYVLSPYMLMLVCVSCLYFYSRWHLQMKPRFA